MFLFLCPKKFKLFDLSEDGVSHNFACFCQVVGGEFVCPFWEVTCVGGCFCVSVFVCVCFLVSISFATIINDLGPPNSATHANTDPTKSLLTVGRRGNHDLFS